MRRVVEDGAKTPYVLSRIVFCGAIAVRQRCFALAESLAQLDQLALEGQVERAEDEMVVYRAG